MAGRFLFEDHAGCLVDGFNSRMVNVPSLTSGLKIKRVDAEFLLLVEKECVFEVCLDALPRQFLNQLALSQQLVHDEFHLRHRCIIMTVASLAGVSGVSYTIRNVGQRSTERRHSSGCVDAGAALSPSCPRSRGL
jgi:hypothetical protein